MNHTLFFCPARRNVTGAKTGRSGRYRDENLSRPVTLSAAKNLWSPAIDAAHLRFSAAQK
jgi:hypothetical protein